MKTLDGEFVCLLKCSAEPWKCQDETCKRPIQNQEGGKSDRETTIKNGKGRTPFWGGTAKKPSVPAMWPWIIPWHLSASVSSCAKLRGWFSNVSFSSQDSMWRLGHFRFVFLPIKWCISEMNDQGRAQMNTKWNDSCPCSYNFSWKVPPLWWLWFLSLDAKDQSSYLSRPSALGALVILRHSYQSEYNYR